MSQPWTPPPAPASVDVPVANNMVLAIIATVVSIIGCCLPWGVISLIFAMQVNKKAAAGDNEGAAKAAKQAKMFAWISIVLGIIAFICNLVFGGLTLIMTSINK